MLISLVKYKGGPRLCIFFCNCTQLLLIEYSLNYVIGKKYLYFLLLCGCNQTRTGLFRLKTVFTPFNSGYRIYFSCKCKLQMSGLFIFLFFLFSGVFTLARHYSLHSVGGGEEGERPVFKCLQIFIRVMLLYLDNDAPSALE